jgi:hypothetical protein
MTYFGPHQQAERIAHEETELRKALAIIERMKARESGEAARADSASADGLKRTVTYDQFDRQQWTYENTGERKVWMDPWRLQGVQIHKFVKDHPGSSIDGIEYIQQGSARFNALVRGGK